MQKIFIYSLSDPTTKEVRYIGKTTNLKSRLTSHITHARQGIKSLVGDWIRYLLKHNNKPSIKIIQECDEYNWEQAEIYWISKLKKSNRLCNTHKGGNLSCNKNTSRGKGKGCTYIKSQNKWLARGSINGIRITLGLFKNEKLAKKEYINFNKNPIAYTNSIREKNCSGVLIFKELKLFKEFTTINECAKYINGDPSAIVACCKGKRKTHKGYSFKYKSDTRKAMG